MDRFDVNPETLADLLRVYLGPQVSEAVIKGTLDRGQSIAVTAAILVADLRGSTPLIRNLGTQAYIDLLNEVYDIIVPCIVEHGGEVLQFTGDGLLAVFPESELAREQNIVCGVAVENAFAAALKADKTVKFKDVAAGLGYGLSYGKIDYGNVGTKDRLAFTVISAEVSRADRLQRLCPTGGSNIAMSEKFAANLPTGQTQSIGAQVLKGFDEGTEVFLPISA